MTWNLHNSENELVSPLIYTNGKSQEDVTQEVIEMFQSYDVVALKGGVGSGKSVVALRVVSHYGSGIIAVPTKVLQRQYVENYCTGRHYHFNLGDRILPVNFMFGRTNFTCDFSGGNCANSDAPCNRKLMSEERRYQAASECLGWSPIYSSSFISEGMIDSLPHCEQIEYQSVKGRKMFFCSDDPCEYYEQFLHYTRDGAIIMNLAKWEAETWAGRKPLTEVEIIDEGDTLLDGLSYKRSIRDTFFERLRRRNEITGEEHILLFEKYRQCIQRNRGYEGLVNGSIIEFLDIFVKKLDEKVGMTQNLVSKVKLFLQYPDMLYAQVKDDHITLFLSRPDVVFSELKSRSGKILLMSATMQTPKIFSSVFRFTDVPLVQAEPKFPGTLKIMSISNSLDISHRNWVKTEVREKYYQILNKIIARATRPTLVQVHALKYMPREHKEQLNQGFQNGVSWSTVTDRGIDLPDDACRSIIITKYPFPDLSDIVFKVLRETYGDNTYWKYVNDMASRELVQQCGRAIRHPDDWCEIWSPDTKVLSSLLRLWKGNKQYIRVGEA